MQISYLHNRKPIFLSEFNIFQAFFFIKSFTTIVNSIFEYVYCLCLLLNDEQTWEMTILHQQGRSFESTGSLKYYSIFIYK